MSKTPSRSLSKESIVALVLSVTIICFVIVNVVVLIPALLTAYAPPGNIESSEPINTQVVNEALTIIEEGSN